MTVWRLLWPEERAQPREEGAARGGAAACAHPSSCAATNAARQVPHKQRGRSLSVLLSVGSKTIRPNLHAMGSFGSRRRQCVRACVRACRHLTHRRLCGAAAQSMPRVSVLPFRRNHVAPSRFCRRGQSCETDPRWDSGHSRTSLTIPPVFSTTSDCGQHAQHAQVRTPRA